LAIKLNPTSSECHFNLASAYSDNGEMEAAIEEYKDSLKHDPENVDCIFHIAQIQEEKGELAEAYSYYKKALGINTTSSRASDGARRLKKIMDERGIKYNE
jgi:tetratricopeptide (TPR) repeat protein